MKPSSFLLNSIVTVLLFSGCSINRLATEKLSDALTGENETVFTGEEDIELARDALPFTLKLYETMLQRDSANPKLLLVTGKLFTLYAQAFVLFPADTLPLSQAGAAKAQYKRAKRLLLRGREYALRAFHETHSDFPPLTGKGNLDSILQLCTPADTTLLFWVGASWLGAVAADRGDLGLALSVRKPVAMLNRLVEFNRTFDRGAAHEILAAYAALSPKAIGGGEASAREHFKMAVDAAGGTKVSPYVSFAASMSVKNGDREEFTQLLQKALSVDDGGNRSVRLQNALYRARARWLLTEVDRFFPPSAAGDSTQHKDTVGTKE